MSYTAIVAYGVGNLKSVTNAMRYLGLDTCITGDEAVLERADAIILPGVGAFPDAAERLRGPGLSHGSTSAPRQWTGWCGSSESECGQCTQPPSA